jgi:hypothetical protein
MTLKSTEVSEKHATTIFTFQKQAKQEAIVEEYVRAHLQYTPKLLSYIQKNL